jgi:archaellum component FlaG (FlaF/FlaG flagellin family)
VNEPTDTGNLRLAIQTAGDGTLTFYAKPYGAANPSAKNISIPSEIEILILGTVWAQENSLYRINGVQNTGLFDPGSNSETTGYRTATNNGNPPTDYIALEEYGGIQIDRELTTEEFEKIEDYFELEVGIAQ